jgi:hypothetical protein
VVTTATAEPAKVLGGFGYTDTDSCGGARDGNSGNYAVAVAFAVGFYSLANYFLKL